MPKNLRKALKKLKKENAICNGIINAQCCTIETLIERPNSEEAKQIKHRHHKLACMVESINLVSA